MGSETLHSQSSGKATRDAFGEALKKLGDTNPHIVVFDADLSVSTKSAVFGKAFPDRFFQMGIAEANMIGTAAGISFTGYVPFICSFGAFLTGRYDTIRVSIGYSQANVKLVGTHAGLGTGEDGYTQMALEDINVMRGLPGMMILQPCDEITTHAAVEFAAKHHGPVYLRLTRQKLPAIHKDKSVFQAGKGIVVQQGEKVAVIGTGSTVSEALKASEIINGAKPTVVDMHTIKPIDKDLIHSLAKTHSTIITAEDHNVVGGLGSAVAEVLSEQGFSGKLIRLGVQDLFGESGKSEELYEKYGISANRIAKVISSLNHK